MEYGLPDAIIFAESDVICTHDAIQYGLDIYINIDVSGFEELFPRAAEIGTVEDKYFRENGVKVFLFTPGFALPKMWFSYVGEFGKFNFSYLRSVSRDT